ncbi:MAG: 2-oxoacid:acceptor oxidoreductase subunit alpha [Candidatus Heimdallarchaeota archaeon]|nr:2-oxoacid:acceptor oxidoreductase subunit alpha [Candidatus Heimdallarchaeota archaeon]MCG3253079.1 2-oxoacid:acceptor oxidoreductase subunit alpha [Candidatus Heimdallarchaeota archaeon]MCK4290216.1 2-oxoacid:acceptor oxidoreductase subunit alpha [Candidatus Heimdallarchaeota archaeon]
MVVEKKQPKVLTGTYFKNGNWAIIEGAIASGIAEFFAYPISPASEIVEYVTYRLPAVGGKAAFIVEDEIASINMCIGASWAGSKVLTATSGPGFSLKQEGLGLAYMTETPLVCVNIMRGGPSTGLPTFSAQGDYMQAQFGSHGDYPAIALTPWSVQECFDLTIEAFNISEQLRSPVILLADGEVGRVMEEITIPDEEDIVVINRKQPPKNTDKSKFRQFDVSGQDDLVPPMAHFGEGYKIFGTGLTHTEDGLPRLDEDLHIELITRLYEKLEINKHLFPEPYTYEIDDAEVVVVATGITARACLQAVMDARDQGIKAGLYRPITVWPFPKEDIEKISQRAEIIVAEMSMGQLIWPVERFAMKKCTLVTRIGGTPPEPYKILDSIRKLAKK